MSATPQPEPEELLYLRAAINQVLDDFLRVASTASVRKMKHIAKNQDLGVISNAIAKVPHEHFPLIQPIYADSVRRIYADASIPGDVAMWACDDLRKRFISGNAQVYREYLKKHHIMLHNEAAAAKLAGPPRQRPDLLTETELEEVVAARKKQWASHNKGDKLSPNEQRHAVSQVLIDLLPQLQGAALDVKVIWDECAKRAAIGQPSSWNPHVQRKFVRLLHRVVETIPESCGKLAVGTDAVVRIDNGLTTAPEMKTDPLYDEAFLLGMNLLLKHFHYKKSGATAEEYPGHNICCVVIDPEGRFIGFDFNQCKLDQNLCSHAEKRLSEALNQVLKPTAAPGKPPSLAGYTFMSTLEPCHMCANFISRMGVTRIGYLMADPMQKDALAIAANLLGLEVYRPSTNWGLRLEEAFKNSSFPEEEITSWLGDDEARKVLTEICAETPLAEAAPKAASFFGRVSDHYPGCVEFHAPEPSDDGTSETESIFRSTTDLLLLEEMEMEEDEEDVC